MFIFPAPSSAPQTPLHVSIPQSPASGSLSSLSLPTSISVESGSLSLSGTSTPSYVRRLRLRAPRGEEAAAGGAIQESIGPNGHEGVRIYTQGGLGLAHLDVGLESASEPSESGLDVEVEVWEWPSVNVSSRGSQVDPNLPNINSLLSDPHHSQPQWLPAHLRTRTISQFTNASNMSALSYFSHSTTPLPNLVPELPIHFPLLAWIRRLFKIDDDTLLLLGVNGCSSADSTLFASTPFDLATSSPTPASSSIIVEGEKKQNQVIALLISDETHAVHHLRAGMQFAASERENPVPCLDPFQLSLRKVIMSPITLVSSAATGAVRLTSDAVSLSSSALGSVGGKWLRQSPV